MTAPERSPAPAPATSATGEVAQPDQLGLAFRAMACGAAAGLAFASAGLWLVRTLQVSGRAPAAPDPHSGIADLIIGSWLGGALVAGALAFRLMAPIRSTYRRGGLSMVAGFGTMIVTFLATPMDSLFGPSGLLALTGLSVLLMAWLLRGVARS